MDFGSIHVAPESRAKIQPVTGLSALRQIWTVQPRAARAVNYKF